MFAVWGSGFREFGSAAKREFRVQRSGFQVYRVLQPKSLKHFPQAGKTGRTCAHRMKQFLSADVNRSLLNQESLQWPAGTKPLVRACIVRVYESEPETL